MKQTFSFNKQQFNRLFPFYILINRNLKVIGLGKSLRKLFDMEKFSNSIILFPFPDRLQQLIHFLI